MHDIPNNIKNMKPEKLVWMDLEMTGLDPNEDVILEVAVEITDMEFKTIETYEARIRHKRDTVLERMNKNIWWRDFPANRDDFLNNLERGKTLQTVEQEMIALLKKHFGESPAILAGNSIHNDRLFIRSWWPELELKLHYRMLDVSSLKILMMGKFGVEFEKKDVHRAFDDIQASIAELQFYLEWLKKSDA